MCIICNLSHDHFDEASKFLDRFSESRDAMKKAADAMLVVSQVADPEHKRKYKRTHKQMVRLMRMWNRLEQERERDSLAADERGPKEKEESHVVN